MKKVILFALVLMNLNITAQKIFKSCDDMTNECLYFPDNHLILANEAKTKGFKIVPSIEEKNGKVYMSGLIGTLYNIGNCCENNELIVMFSDSTKLTFVSWNKFNCEGTAYFDVSESDAEMFLSKSILKMKMTNGYSHDSFTGTTKESSKNYFVSMADNFRNNIVVKYEE